MVSELVDKGMTAVEEKLQTVIDSDVDVLQEASFHIVTSGGKRIRPRLTLLSYLAAGGHDVLAAVPMAAAVEMVHTATLVHDDINDHSLTRRGQITVHARWGRTFALLTGDYLFAKVYEMMAPYGGDYNVRMAAACTRLVEGETLQAAAAKAGSMDRETYKRIISLKTASLFKAAADMGARLAGANEDVVQALADYAYNMGLTFQIIDDILDITGDPEAMGKPVGSDLSQGRGVLAIENGEDGHNRTATAVAASDSMEQMLGRLRESGAIEVARVQAAEMAQRAHAALERVPDSPFRDELAGLVETVLNREQ